MSEEVQYGSPVAVESAIAAAAEKATRADPSLSKGERIRLEYFNRFLSRVFSMPSANGWVLKGGSGMLARVASARATTDVDLFRRGSSLNDALDDLRRLAAIDLGDYFRFELSRHSASLGGEEQVYTEGLRVEFDVYIGVKNKGVLKVDLVVGAVVTDDIEVVWPAVALDLPKMQGAEYHLYPVVDQIADKVCATLTVYKGRPSTREKDLVDLVIFATTQTVNVHKLRRAMVTEASVRAIKLPAEFAIPEGWGRSYPRLAEHVQSCADYQTVDAAMDLMSQFLNPLLDGRVSGENWNCLERRWQ